ncbi:MAG: MoxR family ATPase [Candidatus Poribacteria bacterium]|nr:MoxR family ATPase [Candidatus Poribacteria bacterium]
MDVEAQVEQFRENFNRMKAEVHKRIVGQDEIIDGVLLCLLADGHVLLEGVPGLGKTQLIHTLSEALSLSFKRIQFTPDMMPSDITGTTLLVEDSQGQKQFEFRPGPIFAQIVLVDEINRATPRTQSALLEAMQERTVSVALTSYKLEEPFCVLATQNPLDMEGTYRLPEAQLDRFLFKLHIAFPAEDEMLQILRRTTSETVISIEKVCDAATIQSMRQLVRRVPIAEHLERYIIRLIRATHPDNPDAPEMTKQYVELGASIRGLQAITLTAKIKAMLDARYNVAFEDVQSVALPALRHRMILNFEGEGEGIRTDEVINHILESL